MASLDASPMNIILTVAVVGLIGFFIVLLMKLNPSVEPKRKTQTEDRAEKPRQYQPPSLPLVEPNSPQPQPQPPAKIESPTTTQKPLVILNSVSGNSNTHTGYETTRQTPNQALPPTFTSNKTPPPTANMFTQAKRDCVHHFGYLRTFPKNSPIPDECFGCEKIVDCLVSKKSGKK